ncbi:MAG TPA: hypothetical protein VIJ93_05600, partial [bacterium]
EILEKPLWSFSIDDVPKDTDVVYVPHRDIKNFNPGTWVLTRYYMQTVFPWLFSIDSLGWGGMMQPIQPEMPAGQGYEKLKAWADSGKSKFDQPKGGNFPWKNFVFFPCQLPHDANVLEQSDVGVAEALRATIKFCKEHGHDLMVKEHPANYSSMAPLKKAWTEYSQDWPAGSQGIYWQEQCPYSIHDFINNSKAVFTVNSGVGLESLVYGKEVYHFGDTEYAPVAYKVTIDDISIAWDGLKHDPEKIKSWLETFYNFCYDTITENLDDEQNPFVFMDGRWVSSSGRAIV